MITSTAAKLFLSTPSARRATRPEDAQVYAVIFLSTPSARRATEKVLVFAKGDPEFLSTPSARRATFQGHGLAVVRPISIHALREEGD